MKVLKFKDYIKEAYIGPKGELGDFQLTPKEELEMEAAAYMESIKRSLELDGATEVKTFFEENLARFIFEFRGEYYTLDLDLDTEQAELTSGIPGKDEKRYEMYKGDMMELFDLLAQSGLDGALGYL